MILPRFCLLSSVCLPELLLNLVCIYCILYQSSGLHSSYRLCLLQLQISMAVYDLACLVGEVAEARSDGKALVLR